MRVGLVCPYSFDVPGGVQFHVRDLAEGLLEKGHEVSVLAPAEDDTPIPAYVTSAGRAIPMRYNGSVARVNWGPVISARVRRWLDEGSFDVVHIHEPITPSLALIALWAADGPMVATFHTANLRSRWMQAAYPIVRSSLEKISARIAVSEDARRTLVEHLGGDAVVIPNGVHVDRFVTAPVRPAWQGTAAAPTLAFLGRIDETRKGLGVLCDALPRLVGAVPGVRVLVAGSGDVEAARERCGEHASSVTFLGPVTEGDKASLLRSVDAYVAPHTGGESFGIVLVEAMSAGTCVLASDLGAFRRVLGDGRHGVVFPRGDPDALADAAAALLGDPGRRAALAASGQEAVRRYDWGRVGAEVLAVYETVAPSVARRDSRRRLLTRWRGAS